MPVWLASPAAGVRWELACTGAAGCQPGLHLLQLRLQLQVLQHRVGGPVVRLVQRLLEVVPHHLQLVLRRVI